jgi:hypothetical protein
MEITINLELIKDNQLTPHLYIFLLFLEEDRRYPWSLNKEELEFLQTESWIKINNEGIKLRPKFNLCFPGKHPIKVLKSEDKVVEDWIDAWRDLFPMGVRSAGRLVRGDKQGILKKMKKFVKENPKISVEDIFKATKLYILEKRNDNWRYMTCADYFISKDNSSMLSAWVENISEKESYSSVIEERGGSFHKEI